MNTRHPWQQDAERQRRHNALLDKIYVLVITVILALVAPSAKALNFSFGDIEGSMNVLLTAGATWRAEERDQNLVSKRSYVYADGNTRNLCPDATNGVADDPIGDLLGGCVLNAREHQEFVDAPGLFTQNNDNGNINYDKGDVVHAALKTTLDLELAWGNYALNARGIAFYDPTAVDYEETHLDSIMQPPKTLRDERVEEEIGFNHALESYYLSAEWDIFDRLLSVAVGKQTVSWGESLTFVVNSINSVNVPNVVRLNTPGLDLKELFEPSELVKAGIDLTENTSVEAFYQLKWRPINVAPVGSFFSTSDIAGAGGSYAMLSFGKEPEDPANLQDLDFEYSTETAYAEYENRNGQCGGQVTSATTDSNGNSYDAELLARFGPYKANIKSGEDNGSFGRAICLANAQHARDDGQWGVKFGYYAEWLNDTEFGLFYTNTHSRLPIASFIAADATNVNITPLGPPINTGIGLIDGLLNTLGGLGGTFAALPGNIASATPREVILGSLFSTLFSLNTNPDVNIEVDDAAVLGALSKVDTMAVFLEYPEDIEMFGLSFNTLLGDVSWSGEVAYRPKMPLQIHTGDLTLYALSPAFGTSRDVAARSFYEAYLAGQPFKTYWDGSENSSGQGFTPSSTHQAEAGQVIHGYIELPVANYSSTFLYSTSQNPFGADQMVVIGDVAATQVWDMPEKHVLQLAAPGDDNHAGVGRAELDTVTTVDGTQCNEVDNVLFQALGSPVTGLFSNPVGVIGGLLTNASLFDFTCVPGVLTQTPKTEPLSTFADSFSWGLRALTMLTYNNLIFGANLTQTFGAFLDINGNSPGPGGNFVEGRKRFLLGSEFERGSWAVNLKYNWFTGAGDRNLNADRDNYSLDVRYSF